MLLNLKSLSPNSKKALCFVPKYDFGGNLPDYSLFIALRFCFGLCANGMGSYTLPVELGEMHFSVRQLIHWKFSAMIQMWHAVIKFINSKIVNGVMTIEWATIITLLKTCKRNLMKFLGIHMLFQINLVNFIMFDMNWHL